jgi:hypothetical protein
VKSFAAGAAGWLRRNARSTEENSEMLMYLKSQPESYVLDTEHRTGLAASAERCASPAAIPLWLVLSCSAMLFTIL